VHGLGLNRKRKGGKEDDSWGRDVIEKNQGKGATGCRNSEQCRKRSQGRKQQGVVGEARADDVQVGMRPRGSVMGRNRFG
jgi:hypothetical protein